MASPSLSEHHFLCSICLEVFFDPVSTPCGHNFCKLCISDYWSSSQLCRCPMCNHVFQQRPDLRTNTFISELVALSHQRQTCGQKETKQKGQSPFTDHGDIMCDLCTERKEKAVKSCLVCLASYCEKHLEPHQILVSFKRHKLINPVENLEGKVCRKHERPLEYYCKTDKTCVCQFCLENDHKNHMIMSIEQECEERKRELVKKEADVQEMIQKQRQKVQEVRSSVTVSARSTECAIADTVRMFSSVVQSVHRSQVEVIQEAERRQKDVEKHAEELIRALEQDMEVMQARCSELKVLRQTEDQLHLLCASPALCTFPTSHHTSKVEDQDDRFTETLCRAVSCLEETLMLWLEKIRHQKMKRFAVNLTLDPDTAHPQLTLSDDRKQVRNGRKPKNLPQNPSRFSGLCCVLSKEGFASGSFYFAVEVLQCTSWTVGVAIESVDRKDMYWYPERGVWTVGLFGGVFKAYDKSPVALRPTQKPGVLGVAVDHDSREVSFYNAETGSIIYRFTCCTFGSKLFPYFCTHSLDSSPLNLCPAGLSQ